MKYVVHSRIKLCQKIKFFKFTFYIVTDDFYSQFHINSYFKLIYKDLSSNFFNNGERCPGKCATPSTKMAY